MRTDRKLIKGCIQGNKKTQYRLYDQYAHILFGICRRYCRTKEDAEDVLQESFIKILNYIHQLKDSDRLLPWMKKIVINQAIRHNYNIREMEHLIYLEDIQIEIEIDKSSQIVHASSEDLLLLIQELPSGYRTIFNLFAIDGYKHREIAEMLNISEGTSRSQYSRAIKFLQAKIQKKTTKEKLLYELKD